MNLLHPDWLNLFTKDLALVLPECVLILGMCFVILVPFIKRSSTVLPTVVTTLTLLIALVAVLLGMQPKGEFGEETVYMNVFAGMLMVDPFGQFFKVMLLLFTMLVVLQWLITDHQDVHSLDVPDFLCLLLGATAGMALMASANNLLMILVAMETASLPSFALAGFRKKFKTGSEGALKYVLFGAAASAIMIYGMSLIYGCTGSLSLPAIAEYARIHGFTPLLAIGVAAVIGGIGFKLSAVPLHFWCPDVFQGAPIPVTTFLSVASKGAAVVLLCRVLAAFNPGVASEYGAGLATGVAVMGAVTATWGNLMALQQTHLRRLLAFSSIAHAGYMIMAASIIAVAGADKGTVCAALLFYLFVYLFMNLGAFTVGALIRDQRGSEDIRDYAGLVAKSPMLAGLMMIFLLSLFGMPGLGGFIGKVYIGLEMIKLGVPGFVLVAALLINTLLSLYYYMRPIFYMFQASDAQDRPAVVPRLAARVVLLLCAVMLVWTGIMPGLVVSDVMKNNSVLVTTLDAVQPLQNRPAPAAPAPSAPAHADGPVARAQD